MGSTVPDFDRGLYKAMLDVWKDALVTQAVARRGYGGARHVDGVEQTAYKALIDFIWDNGLNFTEFDPRGVKEFDRDEYEQLSNAYQAALTALFAADNDPEDDGSRASEAARVADDVHDALVEFVELNGLSNTELDPRNPRRWGGAR